ncbi:MAG: CPBP family intramembrane metalloprotease [Bacteroides sp.]|nr:CPBP family intramembrane metalloprotease [Bacteroides sp.]
MNNGISVGSGILWVLIWFGFMLLYTLIDTVLWKKLTPKYERYLNIVTIVLCITVFLSLLTRLNDFSINVLENISVLGILSAAGCSVLLYFLLDRLIDPMLERAFPTSEEKYRETLLSLSKAPIINFLQICILAPVIEEILMRGFLLKGLSISCGGAAALFVSSLLFALLHFNAVQTFSAFICGIILGLLYLFTGSLLCCMIAHAGYNLVSYITTILPLHRKSGL